MDKQLQNIQVVQQKNPSLGLGFNLSNFELFYFISTISVSKIKVDFAGIKGALPSTP
jgi:hypothetical protein